MEVDPAPYRTISTRKVIPATPSYGGEKTTKLSIIDATVARFASCAAVWLYDANEALRDTSLLFENLEKSLRSTLDYYPHFAGQLRWATEDDPTDLTNPRTLGRPVVVYGTETDPGVKLILAAYERRLDEIVPSDEERKSGERVWNATDFPQDDLVPSCKLAFSSNLAEFEGMPGVSVQVTTFACGGFAIGVKMTHCLSDAVCLIQFAKAWAEQSRALFSGLPGSEAILLTKPLFDPRLIDQHAGVCGDGLDADKIKLARSLPMHRYDWWEAGAPSWGTPSTEATKPAAEELRKIKLSPSTPPPWSTWDISAPVDHVQIRFSSGELQRMKEAAGADLAGQQHAPISRLDSVLAHVWILINRARQFQNLQEPVYMDITLGLRTRVNPPLPDTFVGSPIMLCYISRSGESACAAGLGPLALAIREMMSSFTPEAVSAYMHDAAHEVSPQRLWQAFVGERHSLVSSWTRSGCYEVDFVGRGGTSTPRYVQGVMPKTDGLVHVMDTREGTGDFDVSLYLKRSVMERLLADERLRAYAT